MSTNLEKLLLLEDELNKFYQDNYMLDKDVLNDLFDSKHFPERAINLLKKMNQKDILDAIRRINELWAYVNPSIYLKKYQINKKYLNENPSEYLDEYHKLVKTCINCSDICDTTKQFYDMMNRLDADNIEDYLLTKMPNEQLYKLSQESSDWNQKLFYFSYLKKDEK